MERDHVQDAGLLMYLDQTLARIFAEREQNPEHENVAAILDAIMMNEIASLPDPVTVAELGGGAHPDRYHQLFARLLKDPKGHIDWVDISPYMLELAREYLESQQYKERKQIISFKEQDILDYLDNLTNQTLDLAIMKYTLNYIASADINLLFELLSRKLKQGGRLVATVSSLSGVLPGVVPNAQFIYQGKPIPAGETRTLQEGDSYEIQFLKEYGNPAAGPLQGARTTVYYHSKRILEELARRFKFGLYLGSWKTLLPQSQEMTKLDVLVLRKDGDG